MNTLNNITAREALKADLIADLRSRDEQANRNDYARLLAGKQRTELLQRIKKAYKEQAAAEDYGQVLECLAEAELAIFNDADELTLLPPTEGPEPDGAGGAGLVVPMVIEDEPSTAIAAAAPAAPVIILRDAPQLLPAAPALVTEPTNLDIILSAAVPKATPTYSPLAHLDLINAVKEQLDKRGLQVKDERYQQNRKGQQMFGHLTVAGHDTEQDMCIGFRNSYDKSMQVGVVAGNRVIVCSNLMFKGDFRAMQMHQGNVVQELNRILEKGVESIEQQYLLILKDSEKLKQVEVNPRLIHEILGELFYAESIVTEAQLRIIRGELREKTNFGDGTLWDIYNHTTEALKSTPSGLIIGRHIEAHQFYTAKA
ncbi:hypothetical protein GCM10027048_20380 [Hymenobacter coalescens]